MIPLKVRRQRSRGLFVMGGCILAPVLVIYWTVAMDTLPFGTRLDERLLDAHVRFLSSAELAGRGVGTVGESKATAYIVDQLKRLGFSTTLQAVPLEGITVVSSEMRLESGEDHDGRDDQGQQQVVRMQSGEDFVATTELADVAQITIQDESVLFGGYCIDTKQDPQPWDDFCGVDVTNRIVLCLVNDPFPGPLTYFGRWVYKVEEMRRRRAKGVLMVHTNESAGYGWHVLAAGGEVEGLRLAPSTVDGEQDNFQLAIRGWISSQEAQTRLLLEGLEQAFKEASASSFCARETGVRVSANIQVKRRWLTGTNVIGELPVDGSGGRAGEHVILTAHHDHLGVHRKTQERGRDEREGKGNAVDGYYPGALDNASGVAKLLELARAFSLLSRRGACCRRKLVVITPTAEEAVLLGSGYYASHPILPLRECAAVVNMDGMNVWGATSDVVGIGSERSSLGEALVSAARKEELSVATDPSPEQGLFFRSDQLPFARKGVPAIKITHGFNFRNHAQDSKAYADRTVWDYNRNIYHQPTDTYEYLHAQMDPFSGAIQEFRVTLRLLFDLLQAHVTPKWAPGEPFAAAREFAASEN